jgi:DNA-binding GntR family transcriptional regulator
MVATSADRAYRLIKDRIVTLEMQPGSVIRETQMMNELGLGRTPIREALKRLETEMLVEVTPRRGMFVAEIAITDLPQICEVRVELEGLCAALAAQRISPEELEEFRDLVNRHLIAGQAELRELLARDRAFHQLLARASRNRYMQDEIERYYNLSLRIWHLVFNRVRPEDADVDAHVEILRAIEARDSELAKRRMRRHIELFDRAIRESL